MLDAGFCLAYGGAGAGNCDDPVRQAIRAHVRSRDCPILFEHVETIIAGGHFPFWKRCFVRRLQEKINKLLLSPTVWDSDRKLPSAMLRERAIGRSHVTVSIQHNQVPHSGTRRWSRFSRVRRLKVKLRLTMVLFTKCRTDKFHTLL
jgi:hypothetical protein